MLFKTPFSRNRLLLTTVCVFTLCFISGHLLSQKVSKVYLLGTFHFGGSSSDVASTSISSPFGAKKQAEILDLVEILADINPAKVLVEFPYNMQAKLDSNYSDYLNRYDTLSVNEIEQVGFRLAEKLGHERLYAIDHKLDLPLNRIFEYCQKNERMDELNAFIASINDRSGKESEAMDSMTLKSYLAQMNTDFSDQQTNEMYIGKALSWGHGEDEAGVEVASKWWERNIMMMKYIASVIESEDESILIIVGAAHRAVLKDFVRDRSDMQYVEIGNLLK